MKQTSLSYAEYIGKYKDRYNKLFQKHDDITKKKDTLLKEKDDKLQELYKLTIVFTDLKKRNNEMINMQKQLVVKSESLNSKKIEIEKLLSEFQYRHTIELGNIILEIFKIQKSRNKEFISFIGI